ncbi:Eukaryotic-type carbonic anhydrase family protein [Candidatus Nitrospira nitrificans]|jgi:carbonic anhydrase|uniref:Carbonic anhydrase n=2 Tax=Candidatus Nitrospira nitrificans TaxID=1742973 RepID=A0A0S4LIC5_9BACT|nr:Eukaryotic-type carbonic anhydrase family protein [Candidatus Nitrospira nitrificans]
MKGSMVAVSSHSSMMRISIRSLLIMLTLTLPVACVHAGETGHSTWGYDGPHGPLHWSELGPEFSICEKGMAQSPIDLLRAHKTTLDDIQFSYRDAPFHVVNNGHTLQEVEPLSETVKSRYPKHGQTVLHFDKDSTIVFDEDLYLLEQFHFHVPSEHTIDQKHYPMELHLVHHNERHEVAVVAVFMEEGKHNQFFETFLEHAPTKVGEVNDDHNHTVNPMNLLPERKSYYRYSGSFTTPPCSEGVIWAVMQDPIEVSAEQIKKFRALVKHDNARPTQPLHKRFVLETNLPTTTTATKK